MEDVKPYTVEEFDAECAKELFSDFDSVYPHALERIRATVEALERAERERDEADAMLECQIGGIPPCHGPGKQDYDMCRACLLSRCRRAERAREALEVVEGSTTNHKEHP